MDTKQLFAQRTDNIEKNAIREILKVAALPGMTSLAGGLPAPESFPMEMISDLTATVIEKYASGALQYGPTEGFWPLRECIAKRVQTKGIQAVADDIVITTGSQAALDAIAKILISKGDTIAVEAPTYLGALSAFNPFEPQYVEMATDENGVLPESVEAVITSNPVKFLYLVPTFQNPTGRTIPLRRRQEIAAIIKRHNVLLVEDDPYSDLRYRGQALPPIKSLAPEHVIYVGSLSKIFAPGLRLGYHVAPEEIRNWLVIVKQGTDLHTSTFNQALAAEYISGGFLDDHLPKVKTMYHQKQTAMLHALETHMPDGFKWSEPEGGMFIWLTGPQKADAEKINRACIRRKVSFVPGKYFFVTKGKGLETMRLNYSMAGLEQIDRAICIISEVIRRHEY